MQYKLSWSSGKDDTHKKPKGSLREVRRDFVPQYADEKRTKDNIIIKNESLAEAYENVFGEAQNEYNRKQKRKDRKIGNYFESLFGVKPDTVTAEKEIITSDHKEQSFYEWVIGIGDMYNVGLQDTTGSFEDEDGNIHYYEVKANPKAAAKMTEILKEYAEEWDERNPNLHLVCAAIHLDESSPHLHIDAVPWSDGYKKGMSRQQGMDKALAAMGFKGTRETLIKQWQTREREEIVRIAREHGVEIAPPEKGRGVTLTRQEMQKYNAVKHAREAEERKLASVTQSFFDISAKRSKALQEYTKAKSDRDAAEKQYAEYCERLQVYEDNIEAYKKAKKQEADEEIKEYKEQQQKECDNQIQTAYNQQMQQIEQRVREGLNAADEIIDFYGDRIKTDKAFRIFCDDREILKSEQNKMNAAAGSKYTGVPRMSDLKRNEQQQHTDDYSL